MYSNLHYFLAATRMPQVGPVKLARWLEIFSSLAEVFAATEKELQTLGFPPQDIAAIKNPNWSAVEKDLKWVEQSPQHFILTPEHEYYPFLLREVVSAPLVLYVSGDPQILSQPQIAMVGSRNPTSTGTEIAHQFAAFLSASGFVITSGLALGIDAACHRGALTRLQKTIAVLGSGLQQIYPKKHQALAEEIQATGGALVSEFYPDAKAIAEFFPRRNRIISGLSLGIVVVEAAMHSGSLITARFALEQGREVFAVPGSIHNPMARGCHHLIRQGAKLVETAEHIVEELRTFLKIFPGSLRNEAETPSANPSLPAFMTYIGHEPTSLDALVLRSGLTASKVSSILLGLELDGYIRTVPGGYERIQ